MNRDVQALILCFLPIAFVLGAVIGWWLSR